MKKTAILAGAAFMLLFTASVNAQEPTTPPQPVTPTAPAEPVKTQEQPVTQEQQPVTKTSTDKWNNWDKSKYAMQPMPDALTTDRIFPALGTYQLTDKDGATAQVVVTMDPASKGIVWIEGLPQGKIKANLMKSPATYKISEQKLGDETVDAKNVKTLPEGVLIYDKDANLLNVCIGCKYNAEDPGTAFLPAEEAEAATQTETKTKTKAGTTKTKTKVAKVKPVHYSGAKQIEASAVAQPQH